MPLLPTLLLSLAVASRAGGGAVNISWRQAISASQASGGALTTERLDSLGVSLGNMGLRPVDFLEMDREGQRMILDVAASHALERDEFEAKLALVNGNVERTAAALGQSQEDDSALPRQYLEMLEAKAKRSLRLERNHRLDTLRAPQSRAASIGPWRKKQNAPGIPTIGDDGLDEGGSRYSRAERPKTPQAQPLKLQQRARKKIEGRPSRRDRTKRSSRFDHEINTLVALRRAGYSTDSLIKTFRLPTHKGKNLGYSNDLSTELLRYYADSYEERIPVKFDYVPVASLDLPVELKFRATADPRDVRLYDMIGKQALRERGIDVEQFAALSWITKITIAATDGQYEWGSSHRRREYVEVISPQKMAKVLHELIPGISRSVDGLAAIIASFDNRQYADFMVTVQKALR